MLCHKDIKVKSKNHSAKLNPTELALQGEVRGLPESMQQALEEAVKYFHNAKEILKKSPIQFGIYTEPKYVKEAAAMGYLAALPR